MEKFMIKEESGKVTKNIYKVIKYIILLNIFHNIFVNNKISLIEYNSYNVTLKIKGIKKYFTQILMIFQVIVIQMKFI